MERDKVITKIIEEPEALDDDGGLSLKDYPIDSLLIRSEPRTVFEVIRRIKDKKYIMDPDFQRDFIWDETKQSRLIESALMRIPLPVFYLAEQSDGRIVIVDGLQRLMTFYRYLDNKFALKDVSESLKKKKFSDLGSKLQSRIEDTNLVLYLIDSKVPVRAQLDIFDRVNSGVPLTRQQMRNSIYMGPGTKLLKEASILNEFLDATDGSLDPKKMRDREFINRYFAFSIFGYSAYKGDMDTFLADTLGYLNNLSKKELDHFKAKFINSMHNNYTLFGKHSFRKHKNPNERRSVINAALFDVLSVFFASYPTNLILSKKDLILNQFYIIMNDESFWDSITISTNSVKKVLYRFELFNKLIKPLL